MLDRLDRLERDLTLLQRQVYSTDAVPQSSSLPAEDGGNVNVARVEARIADIEERMRDLTGKIEQAEFTASKLSEKLDKMAADNEYRFNALEKNAASPTPSPAVEPAHVQDDASPSEQSDNQDDNTARTSQRSLETNPSHQLGTLPVTGNGARRTAAVPEQQEEDVPQTPEAQYKQAFALVREGNYPQAEVAFTQFIKDNTKHPLTGGAYYWLGETYYAQNIYDKAAIQFLQSYKNFPKGKKAPESLLKLSMSLGKMKKKKEACAMLGKLNAEFPDSSNALKQRAKEEGTRLGCK